jgi:ADP-ribosylglycohydrolase
MRTCATAFYPNINDAFINTKLLSLITRYDINCLLSCLVIVGIINKLLYTNEDVESVIINARNEALIFVKTNGVNQNGYCEIKDDRNIINDDFNKYCDQLIKKLIEQPSSDYSKILEQLELDHSVMLGYTYKCMASAIWALYCAYRDNSYDINDIFKYIDRVVMEGGDADTNCTVVGAVLGAYYHRKNKGKDLQYKHPLFSVPFDLYKTYFQQCQEMINLLCQNKS